MHEKKIWKIRNHGILKPLDKTNYKFSNTNIRILK